MASLKSLSMTAALSALAAAAIGYVAGRSGEDQAAKRSMSEGYSQGLRHGLAYGRFYGRRQSATDEPARNFLWERCAEASGRVEDFIQANRLPLEGKALIGKAMEEEERLALEREKKALDASGSSKK